MLDRMTTKEVESRTQHKQHILGPNIDRIESELLSPTIALILQELVKNGIIKNVPEEIVSKKMKVSYRSPLASSQKSSQVVAVGNVFTAISQFAQADQSVVARFDAHKALNIILGANGADPDILRDEEVVKQEVQQQQQAQADAQSRQQEALISTMESRSALDAAKIAQMQGAM
jgi:hypothetical protein